MASRRRRERRQGPLHRGSRRVVRLQPSAEAVCDRPAGGGGFGGTPTEARAPGGAEFVSFEEAFDSEAKTKFGDLARPRSRPAGARVAATAVPAATATATVIGTVEIGDDRSKPGVRLGGGPESHVDRTGPLTPG